MAEFLNKDPYTYEREKRTFHHALRQYHAGKGVQSSMFRIPKVSGRDLDFYLLYSKVTSLGGVSKVTNEHKWDEVAETLGFPYGCSQIGYVLRHHYIRYVEAYEKVHFKGEDDDEGRGVKRPNTPISFAYRREITDKVRRFQGFALEKCRSSEYDRVVHSLLSSLPNEVDFAINICTLLSNEGKHVIHLEKASVLIDLLLAHAGVFYEGPGSLRKLFEESWQQGAKRNFVQFWYDTIMDREVREVIGPSSKKPQDKRQFKDPELFCVRKLGLSDVEGQRILQIAIIFRNLSFESHNVSTMASHRTLYRFLLLLSHNSCTMLQQLGLDTLTNISSHMVLDSIDYVSTQLMLHTIHKGLENKDKFVTLRSMELIEKLLVVDANLDLVQRCLEPTVYVKVVTLLTIQDIQLLLGALEVMLVMSEREEPFCTKLSSVHCSVDVLVCLITLDAQSLGADAFVGIKIVDHAPDGIHHPIVTMGKAPGGAENAPSGSEAGPSSASGPPALPGTPVKANTPPAQTQRPAQLPSNPSASPTPPPAHQGAQPRDADTENLACQWLGAHYESDHESSISNIDLYAEYLSACGKIMGRNILNSSDFMRCVKLVFPMVTGKKADGETGPQFFISGVKRRQAPLPWKFQAPPSAPSPSASAMIARMAQRHSPSPTVSPSPPPPKGGIFQQGTPQRQPPMGMPLPGSPQVQLGSPKVHLPGQVNGQIPGHIHSPMVSAGSPAPQPHNPAQQQIPMRMLGPGGAPGGSQMAPIAGRPPPPSYNSPQQMRPQGPMLTQPQMPQPPMQQQMQQPQMMQSPSQPPMGMQHQPIQQGQMLHPQSLMAGQGMPGQSYPPHQQQSQPKLMSQSQPPPPPHPAASSQNIPGQMHSQPNFASSAPVLRQPQQQQQVQAQAPHVSQGGPAPPPPHSVPQISQGDNVSVADIIAGNMRVPQHQLNYSVQQTNGRPVNGAVQDQAMNGPQDNGVVSCPMRQGPSGQTSVPSPMGNGLPASLPQATACGAMQNQETYMSLPAGNGQCQVSSSDTNSESSTELNSKGRSSRSRSNSGKKSGRKTPSRQSSKSASPSRSPAVVENAPTSPRDVREDASTEKCQPPLKVQLPDGEVKIEKIPNVHAVGVDEEEDNKEDRMDVAEGIVRQIAGSPVPNQTSCDVQMEESESLVSDDGTIIDEDLQHRGLNGDITPTPEASQLQQVAGVESKELDQVPISTAGVFSQPPQQQQVIQAGPQYNMVASKPSATQMVVSQSQPQQQIVIQKQIPTQCVVSRGVVIRNSQGNFIQTQGGSFVQVHQPQIQVQGHQQQIQMQGHQQQIQVQGHQQQVQVQGHQQQIQVQGHQPQIQMQGHQQQVQVQGHQPQIQMQGHQQQFQVQGQQQIQVQGHQQQIQVQGHQQQIQVQGHQQPIQIQGHQQQVQMQGHQQQIQVQGHQTVIKNQGAFQTQQIQTQVPLQVTWVQQPTAQGQIQQHQVQQQQVNVVAGMPRLQPGQTMIVTNNGQQGSFPQTTIFSQNSGQLVVQNVGGTPQRTGPKPILPQPSPSVTSAAQGQTMGKPILPQPSPVVSMMQQGTQNVQITRFAGMPTRLQGPLSPTNKDSPLIKQLLQQGPVLPSPGGQGDQQPVPQQQQQPQQQHLQQQPQQLQVIQPQQGQIVLNTIGQSQGAPMTVQTHVKVVAQLPKGMSVQSSPTIGNIPQIQLHHQPILPAPPGTPSPNRTPAKPKKSKSKHKKKDKDKDKDRDKNKNGSGKDDHSKTKGDAAGDAASDRDGAVSKANNYSVNVISEQGGKKVVGVVWNGLPVDTKVDDTGCNNKDADVGNQEHEPITKQPMANGYISDKLSNSDVKLGKGGIVSPLASKDIESLFRKSPQTIGDKVDSVVEQLKRDMSSNSAENAILADKLGKSCLNHVVNGDLGPSPKDALVKDSYDGNNTVSDRLDRLLHGAVPNLSQPNIPNVSTPNSKSLVSFCNDVRTTFPSTVPSVTVAAVTNANNNQQSLPVSTTNTCSTVTHTGSNPAAKPQSSGSLRQESNAASGATGPHPVTTSSLPTPAKHPASPLTVQVPTIPSSTTPSFKRPIDDVLQSPDSKQSSTTNPLASPPSNPSTAPPSPSASNSRSSKKRRHSSSSSTSSSSRKSNSTSGKSSAPSVQKYICEWKGCSRALGSGKALHTHLCMDHVLSINYRGVCEWDGCDRIQRQRWSVVSHIMDKHCSEQAVAASMEKRAQRAAQPTPPPSQDSSPQPQPIVYNAHTAYHAIRRSLANPSLKELLGENEGPVTKSIRLTAALILKNMATYSALGRREIRRHELLLARLAISNTESSTTLAKCLTELNRDS